ncbi:hypothetical protein Tco_1005653 [Tanacetum coccineum]|uniref:Zinc finger, CCHC-type n=1 Tax=Tanacetum coccineum TaxID=301880 RepID=A0ABQ5FFM1_9ASTR
MTTTVVNNLVFRGFFEKQKLTGPNFIDWYRQLRIVLSAEDKLDYLDLPISTAPVPAVAGQQVPPETLAAHAAWARKQKEIDVLMIMTMEPDLQRNLENLGAYYMLKELKTLFSKQADMGKTVNELHAMLKLREQYHYKERCSLHAIRAGKVQKKNKKPQLAARGNNKGKGKSKLAYAPKPKIPPPPKKVDPSKDSGFRRSRKLKPGALSLYMGNDQRAAVEAIGSYDLCFPSGLFIVLHKCHYAPFITRGVISVSRLSIVLDTISKNVIEVVMMIFNAIDTKSLKMRFMFVWKDVRKLIQIKWKG